MFDQAIKYVMERKKFLTAGLKTTVSEAAKMMADKNVGAVLVVENDTLAGIFSERDVVFRVVAYGRDPATTVLSEVMTADPKTLDSSKSYGHALTLMHENGFRHIPVVDKGRPVGIVSSRSAMDPDMEEFTSEARRREHYRE